MTTIAPNQELGDHTLLYWRLKPRPGETRQTLAIASELGRETVLLSEEIHQGDAYGPACLRGSLPAVSEGAPGVFVMKGAEEPLYSDTRE